MLASSNPHLVPRLMLLNGGRRAKIARKKCEPKACFGEVVASRNKKFRPAYEANRNYVLGITHQEYSNFFNLLDHQSGYGMRLNSCFGSISLHPKVIWQLFIGIVKYNDNNGAIWILKRCALQ